MAGDKATTGIWHTNILLLTGNKEEEAETETEAETGEGEGSRYSIESGDCR